jgi:hypothetical protein
MIPLQYVNDEGLPGAPPFVILKWQGGLDSATIRTVSVEGPKSPTLAKVVKKDGPSGRPRLHFYRANKFRNFPIDTRFRLLFYGYGINVY